jgi:hypothetical protein
MDDRERIESERRLAQLENELGDLRLRWPAHSVKPAMLIQLEELEEEIETLRERLSQF